MAFYNAYYNSSFQKLVKTLINNLHTYDMQFCNEIICSLIDFLIHRQILVRGYELFYDRGWRPLILSKYNYNL